MSLHIITRHRLRCICLLLILPSCMVGRDEFDKPVIYVLNPLQMDVALVPVLHFSNTLGHEEEGRWYKWPVAVGMDLVCTPLAAVWGGLTFPFNSAKIKRLEARRQRRVYRPHDEVMPERR